MFYIAASACSGKINLHGDAYITSLYLEEK